MTHADWSPDGALEARGAAIDGEFGLTVEDNEHLLGGVVEVVPDAPSRLDYPPMQELQIRLKNVGTEQANVRHRAGAGMNRLLPPVLGRVGVDDSLGERADRHLAAPLTPLSESRNGGKRNQQR
jgi:hypothetical protein